MSVAMVILLLVIGYCSGLTSESHWYTNRSNSFGWPLVTLRASIA